MNPWLKTIIFAPLPVCIDRRRRIVKSFHYSSSGKSFRDFPNGRQCLESISDPEDAFKKEDQAKAIFLRND